MVALDNSFLREYGVTMPIRAVAGISGPYNFYPFEYGQVSDTFGKAPNPEGTQPVNLVTSANAPPMLLASGTSDPIVRKENTQALAEKLRAQGVWVTEKYYEGFGHLEPAMALGAMWRWRMPVLQDTLDFFQTFGAFPSGVARAVYTPEPPVDDKMTALIKGMDASSSRSTTAAAADQTLTRARRAAKCFAEGVHALGDDVADGIGADGVELLRRAGAEEDEILVEVGLGELFVGKEHQCLLGELRCRLSRPGMMASSCLLDLLPGDLDVALLGGHRQADQDAAHRLAHHGGRNIGADELQHLLDLFRAGARRHWLQAPCR
jgi:hypothetical protein